MVARGGPGSGGCLHALAARSQDGGHIGDVALLSPGQAQGCAGWSAGGSPDGAQHLLWGPVPVPQPVLPARALVLPWPLEPWPSPCQDLAPKDPMPSCTSPNIAGSAQSAIPVLCPDSYSPP